MYITIILIKLLNGIASEVVTAYILFLLSVAPLVMWFFQMCFFAMAWYTCYFRLHQPKQLSKTSQLENGVSIIKPLMGTEPLLEENLESHFRLDYAKFELLMCVQDPNDPAIAIVQKLMQKYPNVACRVFKGGKANITNPMVQNMAPAYDAASYDLVWVSTSRIKANTDIILDLVYRAISCKSIAICHQLPFTCNDSLTNLGSIVERVAFGCNMGKNYLALSYLGTHAFTGMSYIVKKPYLDSVGGLSHYGKYLAEDFFLSEALHNKGYSLTLAAIPAQQYVASCSVRSYRERMVRWWRLRVNMLTFPTLALEPLTECLPLGLTTSWAANYLFDLSPIVSFLTHLCLWICLDYCQLRRINGKRLPFGFLSFLSAWSVRELMNIWVYFEGIAHPQTVCWGSRSYHVSLGGISQQIQTPAAADEQRQQKFQ